MQSPQSPYSQPPLPTPDGNLPPAATAPKVGWDAAPPIVRGWAYPLTWLGIIILPLAILGSLALTVAAGIAGILLLLFFAVLFAMDVWLNINLKKGTPAAWTVQIVLSGLILLNIVISLLSGNANMISVIIGGGIHSYILSQWFKPETKAWFGK